MKLNEILQEFIHQSPGVHPETDPFGVTRLVFNERHLIHLKSSSDDQFFYLYAKAGTLPDSVKRGVICEELLEANLFGDGTGRAMFALHRASNSLILMQIFEACITTYENFQRDLQQFFNTLIYWKEKLSKEPTAQSSAESDMLYLISQRNQKIFFV